MKLLEERIKKDGIVLPGNVLKVDSFLNHQIDPELSKAMGEEFARLFGDAGIDRVLTVEASGIAIGVMTALTLHVPLVFARKKKSALINEPVYTHRVFSYTKKEYADILVLQKFLPAGENVLIIDDFLANGEAALGLAKLVAEAGSKASASPSRKPSSPATSACSTKDTTSKRSRASPRSKAARSASRQRTEGAAIVTTTATAAVHPVDQKLPWGRTLVYAFQHVLAMYAGAVAVPLVLAGAVHLSTEELIYLINADLFTCGIATLVQSLSIRDYIGSKLPIVQGCTFTAVTPMIIIANTHGGGAAGLQVVYGAAIFAGVACFVISNFFSKMLRFFPPVVTGSVITVIGLSLMPVAVNWIAGANPSAPDYCEPTHILMAAVVLAIILVIYRVCRGFLRQISVLLGLVIGTLIADALGMADFHAVGEAAALGITTPFAFGYPVFEPVSCLAMTLVMLVTMAETTGDIVAVTEIVDKPMTESMLTKALRADGFSTALGGIFNTFPYTAFAQNIGLIGMTGVRSRYIVAVCGVMLMILGLFPKMAAVVASVPTMVLGGAGLAMFGMVAASGFQALSKAELHKKGNIMVVAISVAVALIPIGVPSFYSKFPTWVQIICNSGITIGSITAILLNLLLRDAPDPDSDRLPKRTAERASRSR